VPRKLLTVLALLFSALAYVMAPTAASSTAADTSVYDATTHARVDVHQFAAAESV
jgi:hypothetical protein